MKKILLLLIMLLPLKVWGISASSAICMDTDNGRVLYGYDIEETHLIASITKIMTAIIAIERGNLDDVIEVTDIIYESFGSSLYIQVGEKLTLRDLLYGLMLRSGNDASLVIAEYISGSKEEFVYLMNEYASNIGMDNTIFYNPNGLEESDGSGNISTSYDMAILTKYAIENNIFKEIFGTKEYKITTNYKSYDWYNKNKLLGLDYITGGKTGYTEKAHRTLVTTATKDNMNLVVVTLNDANDWKDHQTIYESIFASYKSYLLINKNNLEIPHNDYYGKDTLIVKNDYSMTLTEEEIKRVELNINLYKLESYITDMQVGYIEVVLDDVIYHKEPIYVIKEDTKQKMSFWQLMKEWFSKW